MAAALAEAPEGSDTQPVWNGRYDMLDGWRGIAALLVVLHHVSPIKLGAEGVMLFFVISGYCITAAAEAGLRKGLGFRQFMFRRIRRIYPPYLLSVAFFALTRWVRSLTGHGAFHRPLLEWAQNLTLTQWLWLLRHPASYAQLNPTLFVAAYWSLNYEEQFYLIIALVMAAAALVNRRVVLALLTIVALAWITVHPHSIHGVFVDYWPHFAIGSLLFYRLCWMSSAVSCRCTDLAIVALAILFGMLAWRSRGFDDVARPLNYEIFIAASFALVLVAARPLNERFKVSHLGRTFMWLGLISYSLYLINQFNITVVETIASHLVPARAPEIFRIIVKVAGQLMIATVFWYLCERPFLNRPIVPPSGDPPAPRDEVVATSPRISVSG